MLKYSISVHFQCYITAQELSFFYMQSHLSSSFRITFLLMYLLRMKFLLIILLFLLISGRIEVV